MKQQKNEFVKSWTGGINPAAGETGISSLFSERNCISPIPIAPSEDVHSYSQPIILLINTSKAKHGI